MKNKRNTTAIKDFEMNKENPFLKDAIEQIQENVVKNIRQLLIRTKKQYYKLMTPILEKF